MTFGSNLDPNDASYYSNITGFIRGDIKFYNITSQFLDTSTANQTWGPLAKTLMYRTNTSEVVQRSGSWNWAETDKMAMSVVEKSSILEREDLKKKLAVIHVRVFHVSIKAATVEYFWNRATLSSQIQRVLKT